jgi:hypothetical protein
MGWEYGDEAEDKKNDYLTDFTMKLVAVAKEYYPQGTDDDRREIIMAACALIGTMLQGCEYDGDIFQKLGGVIRGYKEQIERGLLDVAGDHHAKEGRQG